MKHPVINLTGALVNDDPVSIQKHELFQNDVKIGDITQETLDYIMNHVDDLQIVKFTDAKTNDDNQLIEVQLFISLKAKSQENKGISKLKVAYYLLVILSSLILLIYAIAYNSEIWLSLLFVATCLSGSYLLYDYLKSKGVVFHREK